MGENHQTQDWHVITVASIDGASTKSDRMTWFGALSGQWAERPSCTQTQIFGYRFYNLSYVLFTLTLILGISHVYEQTIGVSSFRKREPFTKSRHKNKILP
jgi:hypothetical protein